jgi:hypothetical protein
MAIEPQSKLTGSIKKLLASAQSLENFSVKHLPDAVRTKWLQNNAEKQ